VADNTAVYKVELQDGVSGSAEGASEALRGLRSQIEADTKALRGMEAAFKTLNSAKVVNIQAAQELRTKIAAQKQSIADAQAAYVNLGGTFGRIPGQGKPVLSLVERLREAAKSTPGPLGGLLDKLGGLSGLLKSGAIAAGVVAISAAVVALTAATVAGALALAAYGVAQADARRDELLRLEGLTKLRFWYSAAAGSAHELQDATDRVASGVAIGRDQVAGFTEQLYRSGLRGQNLADALEAVAIKASTQGSAAASRFAGLAASISLAGGSVNGLADDIRARLGPIAARQMLSWTVQTKKLKEGFASLFGGLNVEPLLRGLKQVTELFTLNTASGRALRGMIDGLFQPLIDGSEGAGLYVRRFFQGMIIAALRVENVILRLRLWFRETFGGSFAANLDMTTAALWAGEAAVAAVGAAFAATGALVVGALSLAVPFIWGAVTATASLAVAGAVAAAPFLLLAAAFAAAVAVGYQLVQLGKELYPVLLDLGNQAVEWGKNVVSGIVRGVKSGASWVVNAMRDLGAQAMKSFKASLGIASPSKEFAKLGQTLPQGVAQGVERGKPDAQKAVDNMVAVRPPKDAEGGTSSAPAASAPAAGPSIVIQLGGVTITSAAPDLEGMTADLERGLARVFERLALQIAAPLAPRGA